MKKYYEPQAEILRLQEAIVMSNVEHGENVAGDEDFWTKIEG